MVSNIVFANRSGGKVKPLGTRFPCLRQARHKSFSNGLFGMPINFLIWVCTSLAISASTAGAETLEIAPAFVF